MRTKSKNKFLGSILSMVAVILCFGFLLTGCGGNKDTVSTISLSEAKTIIVNALEIEEPQTQVLTYALNEQTENGNRDLLEKLGKFSVLTTENAFNYQTNDEVLNQSFNGNFVYSNSFFTQYLVEMNIMQDTDNSQGTIKEYLSNNNVYIKYNDGETISQTAEDTRGFGYANTMGQAYIAQLDALFTDKAFDMVYQDVVTRESTENGYNLTLKLDIKGFTRLQTINSMTDDEFAQYWTQYEQLINSMPQDLKDYTDISVVVAFDQNDDIISVEMNSKIGSMSSINESVSYYKQNAILKITKYDGEITEPQWVTDYLAEQQ